MKKRVVIYLLLTLVAILVALGVSYHELIWNAIKRFPKDWLLWYFIGTLNTTLVFHFVPKTKIVKKTKAPTTLETN